MRESWLFGRGRLEQTLYDGALLAGAHTFEWRASRPAGVYFCRVESGRRMVSKKLVVLRGSGSR